MAKSGKKKKSLYDKSDVPLREAPNGDEYPEAFAHSLFYLKRRFISSHVSFDLMNPGRVDVGNLGYEQIKWKTWGMGFVWFVGIILSFITAIQTFNVLQPISNFLAEFVCAVVFLIMIWLTFFVGFLFRQAREFRLFDKDSGLMAARVRRRQFMPLPYDEYSIETPDGNTLAVLVSRWDCALIFRQVDLYSSRGLSGDLILTARESSFLLALFHRLTFGVFRKKFPPRYLIIAANGNRLGKLVRVMDWAFWHQLDLTADGDGLLDRRVAVAVAGFLLSFEKPKKPRSKR